MDVDVNAYQEGAGEHEKMVVLVGANEAHSAYSCPGANVLSEESQWVSCENGSGLGSAVLFVFVSSLVRA